MKKIIVAVIAALFTPLVSASGDNYRYHAYVYVQDRERFQIGDQLPNNAVPLVLFEDAPCELPIAGAKKMRAAKVSPITSFAKGCWIEVFAGTMGGRVAQVVEGATGRVWTTPIDLFSLVGIDKDGNGFLLKRTISQP